MYNSTSPECFVFNDGKSETNGILAMLPALLQKQGVDPALIALCGGNRGAFGNNGLSDIIALIVIAAIFGNGNFGGGLFGNRGGNGCVVPNMINNDSNTQLLMQTLQRNGVDIQSLANMTNTSADAITAAINGVSKEICNQGIATGQSFNQVLTSIMQGSNALQTQLANCCCTLRDAITNQGFQNQLGQKDIQNSLLSGFGQTQVGMERGFSQLGYATQDQTNAIKQAVDYNGDRVIAKLEEQDKARMQREINALTAENATLKSRAERQAESAANFAPIYKDIAEIKSKMPNTVPVQWPQLEVWQRNGYYDYGRFGGNFG